MRPIFLVMCVFIMSSMQLTRVASAQDADETDLSNFIVADDEGKILSIADLDQLAASTKEMVSNNQCEDALIQILRVQDAANINANLLRQGLEPFYRARSADQDRVMRQLGREFDKLVAAEQESNRFTRLRNEFWVIEAECLLKLGNDEAAVNRLFRALRFIDGTSEVDLWNRAREPLWKHIGYKAE